MPAQKAVIIRFGLNPPISFQVLGVMGEGRHNVALRVRALDDCPESLRRRDLVLKFDKTEVIRSESPLRSETRIIPLFQEAQKAKGKHCPHVASMLLDQTTPLQFRSTATGQLLGCELGCTIWEHYRVGSLQALAEKLRSADLTLPAGIVAKVFLDLLRAIRATHLGHRDVGFAHRDMCSSNVLVDVRPGETVPTFAMGDFCDGALVLAPRGSRARTEAVRAEVNDVICKVWAGIADLAAPDERGLWTQVRAAVEDAIVHIDLAPSPDPDGACADRALGDAARFLERLCAEAERKLQQDTAAARGGKRLFDRFVHVLHRLRSRNTGTPMTAPTDLDARTMATNDFKLPWGYLIADVSPREPYVADLATLRRPPPR